MVTSHTLFESESLSLHDDDVGRFVALRGSRELEAWNILMLFLSEDGDGALPLVAIKERLLEVASDALFDLEDELF